MAAAQKRTKLERSNSNGSLQEIKSLPDNFIWINDYENMYAINNEGVVLSFVKNKILILKYDKSIDYLRIKLQKKQQKPKNFLIHRLVALHFCYNDDIVNKIEVNHIDKNKLNNHYTNLEWCTPSQNVKHSFIVGFRKLNYGENHHNSKLSNIQILEIKNSIDSVKILANRYNVSIGTVYYILNKKK